MADKTPASYLETPPPEGWDCEFLGNLVDDERGISYGIVQPGRDDPAGVPIVRVNNLRDCRIKTDDVLRVSTSVEAKYERTRLRGGEVLLSLVGTLGECAVVPDELSGWNVARAVAVIPVQDGIDPQWVATCLRSKQLQELVHTWATTTVQATLNLRDVRRLPIVLPPDDVAAWMMEVIGSLEQKLDLNDRTSRALERMARAVFKAWFIDFEPTKAKAAGATTFPGMPQDVFDELPTEIVEGAAGPMPEGWELVTLGDLVEERKTRIKPSAETRALPYVPIDCITSKKIWLENSKSGDEAKSSLILFDEDDILFGAMRPYFHKVCIAPFRGTTRTTVFVLRPRRETDISFALFVLSDAATIDFATQHSVGSTIPYAKWEGSLSDMPLICSNDKLRHAFHMAIWPMVGRMKLSFFESRSLTNLRDALLPRLISGELRIPLDGGGA